MAPRDRHVVEREARRRAAADVQHTGLDRHEDDLGAVFDGEVLPEVDGGHGPGRETAVAVIDDAGGGHGHIAPPPPEWKLGTS